MHRPPPTRFVPAAPAIAAPAPGDAEADRLAARLAGKPETELTAFTQLLARWQVDADSVSVREASRCAAIVAPGIACLRGRASLEQLARFDRPLILLLGDDTGHRAHALLQGVGKQHVRIDLAGARYELARDSLSKVWNGDFIVLWRLPADVPATFDRGASGPGVAWAAERLKAFDGAGTADATFDAALEERVRKLQQSYGIKADGIIGPETLFALSALDDAGPHLARTVE
jgi:general secretion pathway protein A